MAVNSTSALARQLSAASAPGAGASDGQLLARFATDREEAAFAELVRRHGPMVLGVCRRVTGNTHDADDAFQATFLVLARKARAVANQVAIGGWLHGVAHRAALKARTTAARRRARETAAAVRHAGAEAMSESSDVLAVIEQELGRLPTRYRDPLVQCALCGRSRKDVAAELGVPEGTLASRLAKAREMLAERLRRRGLIVPAALTAVAGCPVPGALAEQAVKVATGAVPVAVRRIASEVTRAMLLNKFRAGTLVLVAVALASAAGLGTLSRGAAPPAPDVPAVPVANRADAPGEIKAKELREKVAAAKKELDGVWELQKQTVDGEEVPVQGEYYRYTFAESTLRIEFKHIELDATGRKGKEIAAEVELKYAINPTTNPPQLTAYNKDALLMSIYEVRGNTLKIARHGSSELERPRGFALRDKRVTDLPLTVWEFKRKAPEKPNPPAPIGAAAPAQDPAWKKDFDELYKLRNDAVLKRIAPPFPACRVEYVKTSPRLAPGTEKVPIYMALRVHEKEPTGDPQLWGFGQGDSSIFSMLWHMGVPMHEVEADPKLLRTPIGGDFVFRQDAPVEKLVDALERVVRDECKLAVKLTFKEVEREVVVASGTLKIAPLPGQDKNHVEVFGKEIGKGEVWGDKKGLHGFLLDLGGFLGRRIVNEAEASKDEVFTYGLSVRQSGRQRLNAGLDIPTLPDSVPVPKFDPAIEAEDRDPKLVLANVSKQTGLTFTTEKRKVRVLFVEKDKE